MILKAYKYKLIPNSEQKVLLAKHFGSVRFVFNRFLNERKEEYDNNKKTLNYYDNCSSLTNLKKDEEYKWLFDVSAQSLQQSLKNLEVAYGNFFKKKSKFPKFKSKFDKNSFCIPQAVGFKDDKLFIPKFREGIKLIQHRKLTGTIKQCTISKTVTGEYFVSILVETTHKLVPKTGKIVGIDLGLKDFAITSDDVKYNNNRYTKTYAKKLKKAQQHLSNKVKGSNRYKLQKLKVAKIHKKITNSRVDNLHKVSSDLIKKYDVIVLEDLNIKGMVKNHKLAKSISDASWGKFIELLAYKAQWNDKQIVHVSRWFPSSKTCNCCGYINQNLKLKDRTWTCPSCKVVLDRDLNASKNILKEGLKDISAGIVDYRHGDEIRLASAGTVCDVSKIQV
jgi:putative transposase